ncbi:MAG TPA: DNA mismatch repair protein MutS [Syntrophales bacterium]|nr:DNA mismatch repair protein MutS [Syntrophales bacterium]
MTHLTPAMRQYLEIKEKHKDCILFFRIGDFYEMFFEDAVTASRVLEITLTSRNKDKDAVPLCGVPYHAASGYIARLIENGFKVAVCDQVEDPRTAKGIVRREVVRIVTPGLVLDGDQLPSKENNFLAGISVENERFGAAFMDVTTGDFRVADSDDREFLARELAGIEFRQLLVSERLKGNIILKKLLARKDDCMIDFLPHEYFAPGEARSVLIGKFGGDALKPAGLDDNPAVLAAAGAVTRYVMETQKSGLGHINRIERHNAGRYMSIDGNAKRNLELFATIQDQRRKGTLIHVLDETVTSMGGRRLRWWLHYPLLDPGMIRERLASVSDIKIHHLLRKDLRDALSGVYDLERLGSRVSMGVANARDLVALKSSLSRIPGIKAAISGMSAPLLKRIAEGLDELPETVRLIETAIADDPPPGLHDGGMIREGFDAELDRLVSVCRDGKRWIASMEQRERLKTGIQSLKIGFNTVFGYYIEVTRANSHLVPGDYIRKQTLVNAERYINEELKQYEETVLHADEKRKEKEYSLFAEVRDRVAGEIRRIQISASLLADLDVLTALAEAAERRGYCCPAVDEEEILEIVDGRHPVVETMPLPEGFVPNDTFLDGDRSRLLIITGPNMAGKSTYIRQVALIAIMAQMGSFVPAASARIGIVDRVFTRVGAADNLARGQSTFMVEMTEVAQILRQGTRRSLILLDEVGRGTSTYDGLSIAWAAAEHIHDSPHLRARTLFATHYHQLMDMALTKEGVRNYNVAVKEWGDRIIFLRKIVEGGTNKSYGIQVAKLAGVPEEVITRAKEILSNLEKGEFDDMGMPRLAGRKKNDKTRGAGQHTLFATEEDIILRELSETDIENTTPLDALGLIGAWKARLKK